MLVEVLIRQNKGFETFLIDDYASDIGSKNIAGKIILTILRIILTIPTNTPFLYAAVIFEFPVLRAAIPAIYTKNIFPTLSI